MKYFYALKRIGKMRMREGYSCTEVNLIRAPYTFDSKPMGQLYKTKPFSILEIIF